jgi:predicted lipid-binding transport protein (Tim44 family)
VDALIRAPDVDTPTGERGQALVVAVLFLAIAAVVIGGLRLAQEQILAVAREHRAGEAAAEAATAVAADAYVAELRRVAASTASPRPQPDIPGAVSASSTRQAALQAASELSARNRGVPISDVDIRCALGNVAVSLVLNARTYRAGFAAVECSQR